MNTPRCNTCSCSMEEGFLVDRYGEYSKGSMIWASGSFWSYMLGREKAYPVSTYRCPNCGILQSFAFAEKTRTTWQDKVVEEPARLQSSASISTRDSTNVSATSTVEQNDRELSRA